MNAVKSLIQNLWNYEYKEVKRTHLLYTFFVITFGGLLYVGLEVLFGLHPISQDFSFLNFLGVIKNGDSLPEASTSTSEKFKAIFPYLWVSLAVLCILIRVTVIIASYFQAKKAWGELIFMRNFSTYLLSFLISFLFGIIFITITASIANLLGFDLTKSNNLVEHVVYEIEAFINAYIPTLFSVKSYWLALFLSVILSALPTYCLHRLTHTSRLFWYVFHRAHHCPTHLHPLGAPPAFVFDFLLVALTGTIAIFISKLIYTEPLVMELSLWFMLSYCLEIFNHSYVHYNLVYSNLIIRNLSRLFGDRGVYHLVHHSALPQDQDVNFADGPFNFWDRIFGTYRKPYPEAPPIGLTNQPILKMNPFRIVFSGVLQLIYELKMNKSWRIRFRIIFGNIHFIPAISKDYLKK